MPISISDPNGTSTYYQPAGIKGDKGDTGETGPQGPKGDTGPQGIQGIQGPRGFTGETGATGAKGDKGDTGIQGPAGPQGDQGIRGLTGATGPQGPQGPQGLTGSKGEKGDPGARGPQGIQGVQGPAGETGPRGAAGATGLTWRGTWSNTMNYVNNDAVFYNGASWFASDDPAPGDVPSTSSTVWYPLALQGETGPQGPQGIQGIQGATGPQGIQGIQGETGPQGPQGDPGLDGVAAVTGALTYDAGTHTVGLDESAITVAQSQVTNLTTDLAAKASTTYVDSGLAGKADSSHTHATSDVTGLNTSLASKAPLEQTVVSTSAAATITSADNGKIYQLTGATGRTFTLSSGLPAGARVDFLQDGAGQITFAASGVTIKSKGNKLKTKEQYSGATILALSTTVYHLIGDLA